MDISHDNSRNFVGRIYNRDEECLIIFEHITVVYKFKDAAISHILTFFVANKIYE